MTYPRSAHLRDAWEPAKKCAATSLGDIDSWMARRMLVSRQANRIVRCFIDTVRPGGLTSILRRLRRLFDKLKASEKSYPGPIANRVKRPAFGQCGSRKAG